MADVLRDLGSFVPGGRASEPAAPPMRRPSTSDVLITPPPARVAPRTIFGGDHATGADALGIDGTIDHLAELAAHRGTAAPLCIGLLGAAGTGKSFALARLTARIRDLSARAASVQGPFLSRVHVQTIDAASLGDDLATDLAAALHNGLTQFYPDLAREIGHAARDPHLVLHETNAKLDEARHRLDSERRALDDAGSRRARLVETVLYEAAGSQVDAYARANRAGIETRLVSFGILGEPVRNYKDFVQFVAGSGGRVGLALRSLWGFKGQGKLIVTAIVLVAIGVGIGIAIADQDRWLAALRAGPQAGIAVADWMEAHPDLFALLRKIAFGLAAAAIVANLYRAFSFLQPIFKGARLLTSDLETRRRDLDGLYAHQTKRVDALDGDVERLTKASADAERRLGTGPASEPSPFATAASTSQARNFFDVLARMMADGGTIHAPHRIVAALDDLDAMTPERARATLDTMHRLSGPGLLTIIAADPGRLAAGDRDQLERWIQVPVKLDGAMGTATHDYAKLVRQALGHGTSGVAATAPDATSSALDAPIAETEADLLAALSALAGRSPRAVKRFVNLYALARLDSDRHGALALMMALAQGGTSLERNTVRGALGGDPASWFEPAESGPRLRAALEAARAHDGGVITKANAADAHRRASMFSI